MHCYIPGDPLAVMDAPGQHTLDPDTRVYYLSSGDVLVGQEIRPVTEYILER